ncbi:nuclear transport factor 2 family protein [Tardiphaga robiniae]|uniref:Nuclear transport factor 2 family protein n=1 Tax=Tardiphaga robiniae TaxID=943830 RepID=A0A7G6TU17_9BRAD|nr:nuclear transport factor 2 family protein [Tardiphaga robiniae]QND70249.1 nuclear transport factor 2 family protein [Tardiphaga robiniae]
MNDDDIFATLNRHWDASDANSCDVEHDIYRDDAELHYPQSGEWIKGRENIKQSRAVQSSRKRFSVQRILGSGDLWVSELTITYDETPSYVVSVMEFSEGKVARETQYFAAPFEPSPSRAHLIAQIGETILF